MILFNVKAFWMGCAFGIRGNRRQKSILQKSLSLILYEKKDEWARNKFPQMWGPPWYWLPMPSLIEMATEFPPGNSLNYCLSPNPPKLYQCRKNLLGAISASVDMKMKEKWSTDIKTSRQIFLADINLRSPFTAGDMLDYGRIYFQVLNKTNGHMNYNSMK